MKDASKLTIVSIIAAVGIALLSCFGFLKLVVLQPETLTPVNINSSEINTGSFLRKTNDGEIINLDVNGSLIRAVVARSADKQAYGLMNVTSLSSNEGMLFVFDDLTPRTFWMKDTLISLDIIYLDENLKVVNLFKSTKPNQTTEVYPSQLPAAYVLELNGGTALKLNLNIGESIVIK